MAADYLVSSLQPLALDGPPPYTPEQFLGLCRGQLPETVVGAIVAVMADAPSDHPLAARWRDLATQIRNAIAAERARLHGQDAARWHRPAEGCALFWTNRATAAFQEKDPARRERLLDQVRWDAAGELTPPAAPLSTAAVFTYAIRLGIVLDRAARDTAAGNNVFNRLTAATKIEFKERHT